MCVFHSRWVVSIKARDKLQISDIVVYVRKYPNIKTGIIKTKEMNPKYMCIYI